MSLQPMTSRKKERWVTAVFFILSGLITASWSSRIPDVQRQLELNDAAWGIVLFAMPVGLMTGLLIAGWLIARLGTKIIMVCTCIILSLLLCLIGITHTASQLMVVLFFLGFVRAISTLSINTRSVLVQQLYEQPIVASFHGLWSLAAFTAAAVGTFMIIQQVIPFYHFLIVAVLCSIIALISIKQVSGTTEKVTEKRPIFVKPDNYLLHLGLIGFCAMLCEGTMFDWSVNYFEKAVKADKAMVTTGYTAFIIAMAFGRLVGDKALATFGFFNMLACNGILMSIGFALAAFFPFIVTATLGFLLVGLGSSIVIPVIYSLAGQTKKMPPGYAIASVVLIGNIGFLTGPMLIGSISEAVGMSWAFALVSIISLGIVFLALRVKTISSTVVAIAS